MRANLLIAVFLVSIVTGCVKKTDRNQKSLTAPVVSTALAALGEERLEVLIEIALLEILDIVRSSEGIGFSGNTSVTGGALQQVLTCSVSPTEGLTLNRRWFGNGEIDNSAASGITSPRSIQVVSGRGVLAQKWAHPTVAIACDQDTNLPVVAWSTAESVTNMSLSEELSVDWIADDLEVSEVSQKRIRTYRRTMQGTRVITWTGVEVQTATITTSKTLTSTSTEYELSPENMRIRFEIPSEASLTVQTERQSATGAIMARTINGGIVAQVDDIGKLNLQITELTWGSGKYCPPQSGKLEGTVVNTEEKQIVSFVVRAVGDKLMIARDDLRKEQYLSGFNDCILSVSANSESE